MLKETLRKFAAGIVPPPPSQKMAEFVQATLNGTNPDVPIYGLGSRGTAFDYYGRARNGSEMGRVIIPWGSGEKEKSIDEDTVALELLYTGLTQAELLETGEPFEIKVTKGKKTEYKIPSGALSPTIEQEDPLIASIEAYLNSQKRAVGTRGRDRLVASPELYKALLAEFDHMGLIDDGTQLRRSVSRMFKRSAAHAVVLIDTLGIKKKNPIESVDVHDPGYPKSPFTQEPLVLEFTSLPKIKGIVTSFQNFRKNL